MRRIALAAFVLLLLVPGEAAFGAGPEPGARQSALRLLEPPLTVPGSAAAPVTTTRTTLRRGAAYRLVVTGTVSYTVTRPDGVTIGETEDAFYCFDELNEAAVSPTASCSKNIRYLGALRARVAGSVDHVHAALGLPAVPAYQPSHRYELNFRAPRTGKLAFASTKLASLSPTGSFKLELYGAAKRKRKKRVGGCPASRASSATVRAAATCHWVVNYEVNQSGAPFVSIPDPAAGFAHTETIAVGKIFFKAEPKAGRTSAGRPAGALAHVDNYQSLINPFAFTEGEVKMTPLTATYRRGGGETRLEVKGAVSGVSGTVYAQDRSGGSTQPGDGAVFNAVHDFPLHRDDSLQLRFGCGACIKGAAGIQGLHGHRFGVAAPDARLRVTISRPRSLAGACRCKA